MNTAGTAETVFTYALFQDVIDEPSGLPSDIEAKLIKAKVLAHTHAHTHTPTHTYTRKMFLSLPTNGNTHIHVHTASPPLVHTKTYMRTDEYKSRIVLMPDVDRTSLDMLRAAKKTSTQTEYEKAHRAVSKVTDTDTSADTNTLTHAHTPNPSRGARSAWRGTTRT